MRRFIFYYIFLFSFNTLMGQTNYYVNANLGRDIPTNGGSPGSSAWKSIEYAVNNVVNPNAEIIIINVANGVYNLANNQIEIDRNFTNLAIIGESIENTIVQASDNILTSTTRVFQINAGNNVLLRFLTIRFGSINTNGNGGGIYNNEGNLTLDYCRIAENICGANGIGAGIASNRGNLVITNSTICNNNGPSSPEIEFYGGGIGIADGNATIKSSTVHNNSAPSGGGIAIFLNETFSLSNVLVEIENCTITENTAFNRCGGIRQSFIPGGTQTNFTVSSSINSTTIFNNTALGDFGIGGLGNLSDLRSGVDIKNSIIAGNNASLRPDVYGIINLSNYNLIQDTSGGTISGLNSSNITGVDPQLQSLANNPSRNLTQTCAISENSPAKDKIPVSLPNGAPLYDQRGFVRIDNFDIGAYEYSNIASIKSELDVTREFDLEQNFPNPFNPSTTIKFKLNEDGFVKLTVFNLLGQEVTTLINEFMQSGSHSISFNAGNISSGIYFYKLELQNNSQFRKMILIK